jgi:hypothetical protein
MYLKPGMPKELIRTTYSDKIMRIIIKRARLMITIDDYNNGIDSAQVVKFMDKKQGDLFVLEWSKKDVHSLFLQFAIRTRTYIFVNEKEIEISDETIEDKNIYILNKPGKNIFVIPGKELNKYIDPSKFGLNFEEKILESPERMCILHRGNTRIHWLDEFTLLSDIERNIQKT